MIKKTDFDDLKKKLNLDKIVGSITSLVETKDPYADMSPADALGHKIKQISDNLAQMHTVQAQQAKDLQHVEQLIKDMFADVEALRSKTEGGVETDTTTPKRKPKAPKKKQED